MDFIEDDFAEVTGRAPEHIRDDIETLVDEYMQLLGVRVRPRIEIRDNLGSKWLGQDRYTTRDPSTTTIVLQRRILDDERTLERVLAHEMIHHAEFMAFDPGAIRAMARIGINPASHGLSFLEMARLVNSIKGENFVTVTSDQEYVESTTRGFLVLIVPIGDEGLGYAWTSRITPGIRHCIERYLAKGGAIVYTSDLRWTSGLKLSRRCDRFSIPRTELDREKLRLLYAKGERFT